MDLIIVLFAGIICGILSWKIVSDKEEQRSKECRAVGKDTCMPKMKWQSKVLPACFLVTPPYVIAFMGAKGLDEGILYVVLSCAVFIISVFYLILMVRTISIFGIVDKEIFVWKYYGFANPKRYPMQELARKEYYETDKDGKPVHHVELYQHNELVLKISLNTYYTEKEKVVRFLRQISGEIFKDKKYKEIEERLEKEKRLQQILKEGDNKHS